MKKYLLIILAISTINVMWGQDLKNLGKTFVMRQNYLAQKCDAVGGNPTVTTDALEITFKVTVEAMTTTGYVVSVPDFGDPTKDDKYARYAGVEFYFFIPFTDFNGVCEESIPKHSFTVGLPTIPVKIRFGNGGKGANPRYFRFDGNVNLGLSAGYKYTYGHDRQYAFNLLLGFTVASVNVDSVTTKGRIKANTAAASFSPHFGGVFDFQQFQVGIYTGIDYLYGEPNRYWVYRNQPWVGIGIGYSLFKIGVQDNSNK